MTIEPDTKDWTWVLERACSECGFDASEVPAEGIGAALRENAARWAVVLMYADVEVRPADNVWSPLEYACHVRDVHRIFDGRVRQMLNEDDPQFANWDQDASAIEEAYGEQDPAVVATALTAAAEQVASAYDSVTGDAWDRRGTRSNGSVFTVASLGRYHLHDVVHHLQDVNG
jgi:hypothetical protein